VCKESIVVPFKLQHRIFFVVVMAAVGAVFWSCRGSSRKYLRQGNQCPHLKFGDLSVHEARCWPPLCSVPNAYTTSFR